MPPEWGAFAVREFVVRQSELDYGQRRKYNSCFPYVGQKDCEDLIIEVNKNNVLREFMLNLQSTFYIFAFILTGIKLFLGLFPTLMYRTICKIITSQKILFALTSTDIKNI